MMGKNQMKYSILFRLMARLVKRDKSHFDKFEAFFVSRSDIACESIGSHKINVRVLAQMFEFKEQCESFIKYLKI